VRIYARPRLLAKSLWLLFGLITDRDRGTPVPPVPEEAALLCRQSADKPHYNGV
jgi:hypothetical protein